VLDTNARGSGFDGLFCLRSFLKRSKSRGGGYRSAIKMLAVKIPLKLCFGLGHVTGVLPLPLLLLSLLLLLLLLPLLPLLLLLLLLCLRKDDKLGSK